MVQTKKMNESFFAKLLKEFNVAGELIRARQEEKQGLLNEYDAECKRFFFGKISERTLASSAKKTNKELARLDTEIRKAISRARNASNRSMVLTSAQAPLKFRANLSGISSLSGKKKKKKAKKKKVVKRKPAKRKKAVKKRVVKKKKRVVKRKPAKRKKVVKRKAPVKRKAVKRKPARRKVAKKKVVKKKVKRKRKR